MPDTDHSSQRHPSRREVIALGVGAFVVAAVPLARARRAKLVRRTIPVMGTTAEVAVVHRDEAYAHAAIDAAFEELRLAERQLTRFTRSSDVGRANRLAGRDAVAVSHPTTVVVRDALHWAEASDGIFDPCLGKATELWDVARRETPPDGRSVQRLAGRHLYRYVDVEQTASGGWLRFTDGDVAIDLGGIGKGYGVDRAVGALRDWGIDRGLVNVGGDLYALGSSGDGDPWRVGIRSALDPSTLAGQVDLSDAAVATSGDYLRFFRHNGQHYHHLLDPSTGAPGRTSVRSATVQANSCMTADAAATTAFLADPVRLGHVLRQVAPDARVLSAS
jgi:thiamine biosynthesis lipoprotein